MKYLFSFFISFYLLISFSSFAFAQSPTPASSALPTLTPASVDSFEIFWPVVAGRTKGDAIYFLKTFKEKLREMLLFSSFKKADYNITLSVKRTVEAEKLLLESKDEANAKSTLESAQQKRDKAYDLINRAKADGKKVEDLINTLNNSLDKQKSLLNSIKAKVESEGAKIVIDENITKLNDLKTKLQNESSE